MTYQDIITLMTNSPVTLEIAAQSIGRSVEDLMGSPVDRKTLFVVHAELSAEWAARTADSIDELADGWGVPEG